MTRFFSALGKVDWINVAVWIVAISVAIAGWFVIVHFTFSLLGLNT